MKVIHKHCKNCNKNIVNENHTKRKEGFCNLNCKLQFLFKKSGVTMEQTRKSLTIIGERARTTTGRTKLLNSNMVGVQSGMAEIVKEAIIKWI